MALPTIEVTAEPVTVEQLWRLSTQETKYELINGELVEMSLPGGMHGSISVEIASLLRNFIKAKGKGIVMVETGYRLAANPDTVRSPDISFLAAHKIPAGGIPEGYIDGPPDLAVEVVSPNDTAAKIQEKVQDYLAHGVQLVWVIYPQQRQVVAHYPNGTAKTLQAADTLSGETVLAEFSCQVGDIFG